MHSDQNQLSYIDTNMGGFNYDIFKFLVEKSSFFNSALIDEKTCPDCYCVELFLLCVHNKDKKPWGLGEGYIDKDVLRGYYARSKSKFYDRYRNNLNVNPFIRSEADTDRFIVALKKATKIKIGKNYFNFY